MLKVRPLPAATFGGLVELSDVGERQTSEAWLAWLTDEPESLSQTLDACDGLLLLRGMDGISVAPEQLVRLSTYFGKEVENYHDTLMVATSIHPDVPEILIVSNAPPVNKLPPAAPDPRTRPDGSLPTQFPHRRGWHTDQSYRRPPPDISLFYAVSPALTGQGQTLYANGVAAYAGLSDTLKQRIEHLEGIHVRPGSGRSEAEAKSGKAAQPLPPGQQPQHQPVVRVHPVTGQRALFLCEAGQMDWIEGPFVGMEPGPDGEGARLLYELMTHYTQPEYTYVHEWTVGDLIIYDNRTSIHAATWFDADAASRVMWRTTVWGNPGREYDGEHPSWRVAQA